MTYWVWGVLAGFVWAAAIAAAAPDSQFEPDNDLHRVLKFSFIGYYVLIYIAIWQAATKYKGSKVWSVSAKFVLILTCVPIVVRLLRFVGTQ